MNNKHKTKQSVKEKEAFDELLSNSTKEFKKIECPSCSNTIPAKDMNINDKIAKCNECDSVFSFQEEITALVALPPAKQEVIRPEGIDIFHYNDELDITMTQPQNVVEVLLAIFFPIFAFLFSAIFYKESGNMLFAVLPWTICLLLFYRLFNASKHKVYFSIDDQYMTIKWRPKKFNKDQQFNIEDIDQIYVRSTPTHHSVYMIVNGLEGQKHLKLIPNMQSLSKARYLEQEIERQIGIVDRRIPEEAL